MRRPDAPRLARARWPDGSFVNLDDDNFPLILDRSEERQTLTLEPVFYSPLKES